MLDDLKLIHERDAHDLLGAIERKHAADTELEKSLANNYRATVPTAHNAAKQIALKIIGKTPIIYTGPVLAEAAVHWKYCLNMYAKHLAWTITYPDNLEAELTGWTQQPINKPYTIIDLQSTFDDEIVQKAFATASRELSGVRPMPHAIQAEGHTVEQQIAWTSALGEFIAVYVAILTGVNTTKRPMEYKGDQ